MPLSTLPLDLKIPSWIMDPDLSISLLASRAYNRLVSTKTD